MKIQTLTLETGIITILFRVILVDVFIKKRKSLH